LNFAQVPGQAAAKEGLLKMWQNDVFPHALLLIGAEGVGGLPLGIALATYIFCTEKTGTDSCGHCANCGKIQRMEHADLHFSFPSIAPKPGVKAKSSAYIKEFRTFVKQSPYGTTFDWLQYINAENKQGNITAEECREIIETLYLKSYEGGKKVLIIWRPEYLGKEGNILLKLIEEPPKDTHIIFIAENSDDLLATIKSRTQIVRLAPVPATEIATKLEQGWGVEANRATQIAHLASGSITEALRIMRQSENDLFPTVKDLFNHIFVGNGIGLTKFAEEWAKYGREQQKNLLQYIIHLLEQAIRARYSPHAPLTLPEAEAQFVQKLAKTKLTLDGFGELTNELSQTMYYIQRNANSKVQLHALCIKMQYIVQQKSMPVI
jgi:DNA polymerase-3 subunit delta'